MFHRTLLAIFRRLPKRAQAVAEWLLSMKTTLGVAVVALDGEGRVLLFQHSYQPVGSWQLPGGHAKLGERPDAAMLRELAEEGGARVELGEILTVEVTSRWPARTTVYYLGTLHGLPLRTTPEVTGWKLLSMDALAEVDPAQRRIIEAATRRRVSDAKAE